MTKEPKPRRDGNCHVCRKPRVFNFNKSVPREEYDRDPFCSTVCCRAYYGVTWNKVSLGR
jgi:hypothetical protein